MITCEQLKQLQTGLRAGQLNGAVVGPHQVLDRLLTLLVNEATQREKSIAPKPKDGK